MPCPSGPSPKCPKCGLAWRGIVRGNTLVCECSWSEVVNLSYEDLLLAYVNLGKELLATQTSREFYFRKYLMHGRE